MEPSENGSTRRVSLNPSQAHCLNQSVMLAKRWAFPIPAGPKLSCGRRSSGKLSGTTPRPLIETYTSGSTNFVTMKTFPHQIPGICADRSEEPGRPLPGPPPRPQHPRRSRSQPTEYSLIFVLASLTPPVVRDPLVFTELESQAKFNIGGSPSFIRSNSFSCGCSRRR